MPNNHLLKFTATFDKQPLEGSFPLSFVIHRLYLKAFVFTMYCYSASLSFKNVSLSQELL